MYVYMHVLGKVGMTAC